MRLSGDETVESTRRLWRSVLKLRPTNYRVAQPSYNYSLIVRGRVPSPRAHHHPPASHADPFAIYPSTIFPVVVHSGQIRLNYRVQPYYTILLKYTIFDFRQIGFFFFLFNLNGLHVTHVIMWYGIFVPSNICKHVITEISIFSWNHFPKY